MVRGFGDLLYALLRQRGMSIRTFAKVVETPAPNFSEIKGGRRKVPWDQAIRWADVLKLSGSERQRFLDLAALTQAPERIQALVTAAEERQGRTIREIGTG